MLTRRDAQPDCLLRKNYPKAAVVEAVDGSVASAISYTAVRRIVVPAATAQNTIRPGGRAPRVADRAVGVIVIIIPVSAPLPNIAAHIV